MAATGKVLYPSTSTATLACTIAALASDAALLAGRASTAVDNTVNLDLDHGLAGSFTAGTGPTAGVIEVWVYTLLSEAAGVPAFVDAITGVDANKSMTSAGIKQNALVLAASIPTDTTTGRVYPFAMRSVASLFGGVMPPFWGAFVVHNCVVALAAGALQYLRAQNQSV